MSTIKSLGDEAIVVDSTQRAVQMCLELLGSGEYGFPVVLPVTAPVEVIAAVLRAGAVPCLLDISTATLNIDPKLFKAALEEFKVGMVSIFCEVPGQPIPGELVNMLTPQSVAILYTTATPKKGLDRGPYTFVVNDLRNYIDKGAVIYHGYSDQLVQLKEARGGPLGLDAVLPEESAYLLNSRLEHHDPQANQKHFEQIKDAFSSTSVGILWEASLESRQFGIVVPNAERAVKRLRDNFYTADTLVNPAHLLPQIAARYKDGASYPNAEAVFNKLITVEVLDYGEVAIKKLVDIIKEEYAQDA